MNNTSIFTNVFKSLFGSSITPTSSQFVPITAQDGTPAGVSSMANLASVLGEFILGRSTTRMKENDDLNDYKNGGTYTSSQASITNSILNKPEESPYAIYLIVLQPYNNIHNTIVHQIVITTTGIFHRYYENHSNIETWYPWKRIITGSV